MNLVEQVLSMKNMKSKFKNNFIFYKKINHLNILEEKIPFKIKRIFFSKNLSKKSIIGEHANKKNREILICLNGGFQLSLETYNSKKKLNITSLSPAIIINPMTWLTMTNFKKNTVYIVFCSEKFNEKDYIRNYDSFKKNLI